jgi:hypothetical protein
VFSIVPYELTRTPVKSSERRTAAPDTMQPPDTSDEMPTPRRPVDVVARTSRAA